jgi:hypothetical protein
MLFRRVSRFVPLVCCLSLPVSPSLLKVVVAIRDIPQYLDPFEMSDIALCPEYLDKSTVSLLDKQL